MIKALLYKDLINIKSYSLIMLIIGMLLMLIINQPGISSIAYVFALSLILTTFSLDERSGHIKEEIAIIGNRKIFVREKYLITLIFISIGAIFSFCFESIKGLIAGDFSLLFSSFCLYQSLTMGIIAASIVLPFFFRLGAEKARLISFLCILIPLIFASLMQNIIDQTDLSIGILCVILSAITIISAPVSYFVSNQLFSDMEF